MDLLVYWDEFLYYESRSLGLAFVVIQAVLTALCALLVRAAAKRRQQ